MFVLCRPCPPNLQALWLRHTLPAHFLKPPFQHSTMGKARADKKSLVGASKATLKAASRRLTKEKSRIRSGLTHLRQIEHQIDQEEKNEKDIEQIVLELRRTPQKIQACKQAVLSDMFLDDSSDDDLNETFAFLHRVPVALLSQCLQEFGINLEGPAMKQLKKSEKNIISKLFHFAVMTNSQTRIPSHNRKEFKEHFCKRYTELRRLISGEQWGAMTCVDWASCGYYAFTGAKGEPFTQVTLRHPKPIKVALPSHVHITEEWQLTDNWSFSGARISSPPGVKPKVSFLIQDFMGTSMEYKELVERYAEDTSAGHGSGSAPSAGTPPSTESSALGGKGLQGSGPGTGGSQTAAPPANGTSSPEAVKGCRGHGPQGTQTPPANRSPNPDWTSEIMSKRVKKLRESAASSI